MAVGVVVVSTMINLLAFFTAPSSGNWCVCKDVGESVLQKTLDYACGAGADCNPIRQNGPCFQPNTVRAHCNYAVNSYFQRKSQAQDSCNFAGTATLSASDPSTSGCNYPSTATSASSGSSSSPVTTTPSTSTGTSSSSSSTTTSTATPYSATPGVLGGIGSGSGLGPSGAGMNSDDSHAVLTNFLSSFSSFLLFSAFILIL